jgi:light-regulated signal transduction histidine kinase (bacteriophytochrome)
MNPDAKCDRPSVDELDALVDQLAHDLKAPLVTIKSFVDLALQDVESGDMAQLRSDLGRVAAAAGKMTEAIDALGGMWRETSRNRSA